MTTTRGATKYIVDFHETTSDGTLISSGSYTLPDDFLTDGYTLEYLRGPIAPLSARFYKVKDNLTDHFAQKHVEMNRSKS